MWEEQEENQNHYELFGFLESEYLANPSPSIGVIKERYDQKCRVATDESLLASLTAAYNELINPVSRARYDKKLRAQKCEAKAQEAAEEQQLKAASAPQATLSEAFEIFGFSEGWLNENGEPVTESMITEKYKKLCFQYHPDKAKENTAPAVFIKLLPAKELLEKELQKYIFAISKPPKVKQGRKNKAEGPVSTDPRNDKQKRSKANAAEKKDAAWKSTESNIRKLVMNNNAPELQKSLNRLVSSKIASYKIYALIDEMLSIAVKNPQEDILKMLLERVVTYALKRKEGGTPSIRKKRLTTGVEEAKRLLDVHIPTTNVALNNTLWFYIRDLERGGGEPTLEHIQAPLQPTSNTVPTPTFFPGSFSSFSTSFPTKEEKKVAPEMGARSTPRSEQKQSFQAPPVFTPPFLPDFMSSMPFSSYRKPVQPMQKEKVELEVPDTWRVGPEGDELGLDLIREKEVDMSFGAWQACNGLDLTGSEEVNASFDQWLAGDNEGLLDGGGLSAANGRSSDSTADMLQALGGPGNSQQQAPQQMSPPENIVQRQAVPRTEKVELDPDGDPTFLGASFHGCR